MKLIVTGASGFLGKNYLLSTNPKDKVFALYNKTQDFLDFLNINKLTWITPIQVDLEDDKMILNKFANDKEFDLCVYFAANGDPALSVKDVAFDLKSNTLCLINILNLLSIQRIVFFSSGAVYDGMSGPVSYEKSKELNPELPYAISKLASENYIKFFHKYGKIKSYVIVRFFGAFGPYEPKRKIYTKLINNFAMDKNSEFTIRGNGKNFIDAMYIDDTIKAIKLLESSTETFGLDLYSGQKKTISDLVTTIANYFEINPKIVSVGEIPEFIEFYSVDDTMDKKFNFKFDFTLLDGIKKQFEFLKNKI